jgi:hypothetical protein
MSGGNIKQARKRAQALFDSEQNVMLLLSAPQRGG